MAGRGVLLILFVLVHFSSGNVTTTATEAAAAAAVTTTTTTTTMSEPTELIPTTDSHTVRPDDQQPLDLTRLYAELTAMKAELHGITAEWEKFQGLYMHTMETKILQIFTTMTSLDTNVKALQERAHVWDIFKHHIEAWSDHMKSVDKKIDLIKRSQDTSFAVESRMVTMEQKNNLIYEKVDMVNEKMHDMLKILFNQKLQKGSCDPSELKDATLSRLANIEKQITIIQNNHCKTSPRRLRQHNETYYPVQDNREPSASSGKEMKQLISLHKRTLNNVEYLSETVTTLNVTTNRLQKSLATCCQNNEHRVVHLRDSVDSAFQKLERIYLNLENSVKSIHTNRTGSGIVEAKSRKIELDDPSGRAVDEDVDGSGSGSGDYELKKISDLFAKPKQPLVTKQTFRSNCHEMRGGVDGVYSFGFTDDVNEQGRPFNHRYCRFPSDNSVGWTVIQRRGQFGEPRENFNRSWADYKNGFGELHKEFWYGNDFIHQLTNEEGQVELKIEMEDFAGRRGVVHYSRFYVSSERSFYRLDVQGFNGNVSDSLLYHNQMYFSTYDSANDHSSDIPCALSHGSGWWWNNCLESNLNGKYSEDPRNTQYTGIIWEQWLGDYSLKAVTMMIRPSSPNGLWIDNEDDDDIVDSPLGPPEDP